jgi:6-phosphogluconolactonase
MAHDALLSRVPVPPENIHRMPAEAADLDAAAQAYEQALRDYSGPASGSPGDDNWPRLDLALLGIGNDGHTASLFPGTPAVEEGRRWVVPTGNAPTAPHVRRLTLTLPVLNHAGEIVFLVSGAGKAGLVREILSGSAADKYPAARVRADTPGGNLLWMLDPPAASGLHT